MEGKQARYERWERTLNDIAHEPGTRAKENEMDSSAKI